MSRRDQNEQKLLVSLEAIDGEWLLAIATPDGQLLFLYPFLHFIADTADDMLSQHHGQEAIHDLRDLVEGLQTVAGEMRQQIVERALGYNNDVFLYDDWNN